MPITMENLPDIIQATEADLGENRLTELATKLQEYKFSTFFKNKRSYVGRQIEFNFRHKTSQNARMVTPFSSDQVNVDDTISKGSVPFRHAETSYLVELNELQGNAGKRQLLNLVQLRRSDCLIDMAEELEKQLWGAASDPDKDAFGIQYWLRPSATKGWNGANHPNYAAGPGNINANTYTAWRNWTDTYANFDPTSATGVSAVIKEAMAATRFVPPPNTKMPDYALGGGWCLYMRYATHEQIERGLMAANDAIGFDVAGPTITYRGAMMEVAFALESTHNRGGTFDASITEEEENIIYGVNHSSWHLATLSGVDMRTTTVPNTPNHRCTTTFYDLTYNHLCKDRSRNFVIYKV